MRLLITDVLYPNRYSTWRNIMIEHLVREQGADVLVFKTGRFKRLDSYDFDFCNRDGLLEGYKKFSLGYHDKKREIYALCSDRFGDYDAVYHIFASCFSNFNNHFPGTPLERQFIHLYPGPGYLFQYVAFPKETKIISTHPETTKLYQDSHDTIECLISPQTTSKENITKKYFHEKPQMTVCFASVSKGELKGDAVYLNIVETYSNLFPNDNVNFISIGNCATHPKIKNHSPMDYVTLGNFYRENVDVYVSPETGLMPNGWPLGVEAAVTGSVLLTTDSRNTASKMGIPEPSFLVCRTVEDFVNTIRRLYVDREYANLCSCNAQSFLLKHVSPSAQQEKILDFIRKNV